MASVPKSFIPLLSKVRELDYRKRRLPFTPLEPVRHRFTMPGIEDDEPNIYQLAIEREGDFARSTLVLPPDLPSGSIAKRGDDLLEDKVDEEEDGEDMEETAGGEEVVGRVKPQVVDSMDLIADMDLEEGDNLQEALENEGGKLVPDDDPIRPDLDPQITREEGIYIGRADLDNIKNQLGEQYKKASPDNRKHILRSYLFAQRMSNDSSQSSNIAQFKDRYVLGIMKRLVQKQPSLYRLDPNDAEKVVAAPALYPTVIGRLLSVDYNGLSLFAWALYGAFTYNQDNAPRVFMEIISNSSPDRDVLFSKKMRSPLWYDGASVYVLSPTGLRIYLGMTTDFKKRFSTHKSEGVNHKVRAEYELRKLDQWAKVQPVFIFPEQDEFGVVLLHVVEHALIVAFDATTKPNGLNCNLMDRFVHDKVLTRRRVRQMVEALSYAYTTDTRLMIPSHVDEEAWRAITLGSLGEDLGLWAHNIRSKLTNLTDPIVDAHASDAYREAMVAPLPGYKGLPEEGEYYYRPRHFWRPVSHEQKGRISHRIYGASGSFTLTGALDRLVALLEEAPKDGLTNPKAKSKTAASTSTSAQASTSAESSKPTSKA